MSNSMSHDLRALSQDWFASVWNRKDEASIARLAHANLLCHGLGDSEKPQPGLETFERVYRNFISAFPDIHFNVNDILVDGEKTAVRVTFSATHTGSGIGVPPTHKRITATAITIIHWRDGKIIEAWNEFDAAGMLQQLQTPTATLRA